jgi:hypothetical protein
MQNLVSCRYIEWYQDPTLTRDVYEGGNLVNLSKIIPLELFLKFGLFQRTLIREDFSFGNFKIYSAAFKYFQSAFSSSSSETLSLNLIVFWIIFSKLTTEFFVPIHTKYECIISSPCSD